MKKLFIILLAASLIGGVVSCNSGTQDPPKTVA